MLFKKEFQEVFIRLCDLESQVYELTNRMNKLEDKKATEEWRKNAIKSYNEGWSNSPFNQLMREREKGIHPTEHDKYL